MISLTKLLIELLHNLVFNMLTGNNRIVCVTFHAVTMLNGTKKESRKNIISAYSPNCTFQFFCKEAIQRDKLMRHR